MRTSDNALEKLHSWGTNSEAHSRHTNLLSFCPTRKDGHTFPLPSPLLLLLPWAL
jgi:hypothetical protein